MKINWVRLSISVSLFISSILTGAIHNDTFSVDTMAIVSIMLFCFSLLILALSTSNKDKETK
jgi:uncharacterized membrane protein YoaK (UPF0700 family)